MARCEYSCAYLLPIAHTRLRVHRAPGIPHALCLQGGKFMQTSGASRREIAEARLQHSSRHRPRRRAIQYSETPVIESISRGVLDNPLPRGTTSQWISAPLRGANGSRECAPDDRLRDEAIHSYFLAFFC